MIVNHWTVLSVSCLQCHYIFLYRYTRHAAPLTVLPSSEQSVMIRPLSVSSTIYMHLSCLSFLPLSLSLSSAWAIQTHEARMHLIHPFLSLAMSLASSHDANLISVLSVSSFIRHVVLGLPFLPFSFRSQCLGCRAVTLLFHTQHVYNRTALFDQWIDRRILVLIVQMGREFYIPFNFLNTVLALSILFAISSPPPSWFVTTSPR